MCVCVFMCMYACVSLALFLENEAAVFCTEAEKFLCVYNIGTGFVQFHTQCNKNQALKIV
jgi:hypothetical protein